MLGKLQDLSYSTVAGVGNGLKYIATTLLQPVENLLIGKLRKAVFDARKFGDELTDEAVKNNGIGMARIGPPLPGLYTNVLVIVPKSNEEMEAVLKKFEEKPEGRSPLDTLIDFVGAGPVTSVVTLTEKQISEGPKELDPRKILHPFISNVNGFLKSARGVFTDQLAQWAKRQDEGMSLDQVKYILRCAISEQFFGTPLTPDESATLSTALRRVQQKQLHPLSFEARREYQQGKFDCRMFGQKFATDRKDHIQAGLKNYKKSSNLISHVIAKLEKTKRNDSLDLDEESVDLDVNSVDIQTHLNDPKVTSSVFVIALIDIVAANLMDILAESTKQPEIYRKLYNELKTVSDENNLISDEILKSSESLPYLDCVIKEGLRHLSPSVLVRYTKEGFHTEHTTIPPKSTVVINPKALHHDPTFWGNDADKFNPDRMRGINMWKVPFIPFSIGDRRCAGVKIAEGLMKSFLSILVLNYEINPVPGQTMHGVDYELAIVPEPEPDYRITLHPRHKLDMHKSEHMTENFRLQI
jgi:cytochrome P450